jgi:hypothetical protein
MTPSVTVGHFKPPAKFQRQPDGRIDFLVRVADRFQVKGGVDVCQRFDVSIPD